MTKMIAVAFLALVGALAPAFAQTDYPSKPVTIVVPFPAGGSSDLVSRVLAEELARKWKQQVVVENKAGGSTVIGNTYVARARPDGYTMLMVSSGFVILPAVRDTLPYDTMKDFIPISLFIDAPLAVVGSPGLAANTIAELIAEAKKRTDRPLTYCTPGAASTSRMASELVMRKTDTTFKHIAYQGESLCIPDLMSNRVDFQMGTWSVQRPYVDQGKIKLLAVLYRNRLPEQPNVQTLAEAIPGLGGPQGAFNSVAVPAGTPKEIVAKIADDVKAIVESEGYRNKIISLGAYPRYTTPEETLALLQSEMATWREIAKAANIKVE